MFFFSIISLQFLLALLIPLSPCHPSQGCCGLASPFWVEGQAYTGRIWGTKEHRWNVTE